MIKSAIKGAGLGRDVLLVTDGRFSGGTTGLCVGHISANGHFTSLERMQLLPAAYGGEDNVNKFARVKEITTEWIDYKDAWLSNASTKAFITVALDNTGNVVITKTDPYADL